MFDRMDEHIYADTYGDEPGDYAELLELIHTRPAWHADAACKEYPEVNFFPHRDKAAQAAVAVCSSLPGACGVSGVGDGPGARIS